MKHLKLCTTLTVLWAALVPALAPANDNVQDTLYTQTNAATGNEVLVYQRLANGQMQAAGQFSTGGTGTGAGLGNQGALALSDSGRYLFAVNAGSNDVSVFRVDQDGLELIDRAAEEGIRPVSVTVDHNRVYVVNSGDDSIFGFSFDPSSGKLAPLANSHFNLSGNATGPGQISFDREGEALVVTEKATNKITTFALNDDGTPASRHVVDSAGKTPFGFAFGKRDQFFVSEAEGGAANGATVSAYGLHEDGTVELIDGAVAAGQTAACWLATTPNGRLAFTADTPANAISAFAVDYSGHLSLLQSKAAEENHPVDLTVSEDGSTLYTLSSGDHSIGVYRISKSGALDKLQSIASLPAGVTGLILR